MCHEPHELREAIIAYAARFDARTLTAAHASQMIGLWAQIEASVASIKALTAARAAEGRTWEHDGYRSPSEQLAARAGMSPAAAKRALETGRRLVDQPEVAAAALAGRVSLEQATAIADGVAADPTKAAALIDKAQHSSLPELNEEVAKVKAATGDAEQRRANRHTKRSLRRWSDRDGAFHTHLYGHPEDGARLWQMLDPIRRRLNMARRESGAPVETLDALDYDALITMATIATGTDAELTLADLVELGLFPQLDTLVPAPRAIPPPPPRTLSPPGVEPDLFSTTTTAVDTVDAPPAPAGSKPRRGRKKLAGSPIRVMIRVDLDVLLRGVAVDGELCEIPGYGPVPVSVVKDLTATGNAFFIAVLTKAHAVVAVSHLGRHPNAYQRSALDFLHPTCAVEGCSSRDGLEYDHRLDFAKTHFTAFDFLDKLCRHHHRQKTDHGWALVDGRGKRAFVPPTTAATPATPQQPRHQPHYPHNHTTHPPLAVYEPETPRLQFPAGGSPERRGPGVGLDDDSLQVGSSHVGQSLLGGGEESSTEAVTAMTGGDGQPIDRSTPAIPACDD